jgi:acetyltransferase-like isoleucine patch superfamily enzyme
VLPGSNIGRHVVVGANSVVTGDLPDNCVAAGVPARVIKQL